MAEKELHVAGMGSAIVDILVDVTDEELGSFGIAKDSYGVLSTAEREALLQKLEGRTPVLVGGGSVANSIVTLAQLGARGAFICALGNDDYGDHFREEMNGFGLYLPVSSIEGHATATLVSFITPDGHRTMRVDWGVASQMAPQYVDERTIARSEWLFIEGYLVAAAPGVAQAARHAAEIAKQHGTKVAVTCSESWVIEGFRQQLDAVLELADLVFANDKEARALCGVSHTEQAFLQLTQRYPSVVVTVGPEGAHLWYNQVRSHVPAFPCEPRDLTGAGDALAGGFLYGITNGWTAEQSARGGCLLAREVISSVGARLQGGASTLWSRAVAA